jgi:multidrug efflux pump subunit AcrA (membrane-fusion protein)
LWLWPAIFVVVAAFAFHYRDQLAARWRPTPAASAVRTVQARSGVLEQTVRLAGETAAERSAYLRAPILRGRRSQGGGTADFRLILEELVESGSHVKEGDVVAVFDRQYMLNRLDNSRAAQVERKADLQKTLAQLEMDRATQQQKLRVAKGNMDKAALDLKTAPVRSPIQVELFRLASEEAQMQYNALLRETKYLDIAETAQMRQSQLDLQEADLELRRAEANVDRMVVRAPMDGLAVVQTIFRGGEYGQIRAGEELRSGQPYLQIVDPRSMIVEAKANQVDVERLRIGASAHVRFDAFSSLELPARVFSISPLAKSGGWRGNYITEAPVYLKLEGMDPRVIPSLSVSADVVVGREESTGIVPLEAIFHDGEDGRPFAVVQGPTSWERRDLELGLANNVAIAVRSGLSEGEIVAAERPPETE